MFHIVIDIRQIKFQEYDGDLESDFLEFLGQVQRLDKEQPVEIEVDFRKLRVN